MLQCVAFQTLLQTLLTIKALLPTDESPSVCIKRNDANLGRDTLCFGIMTTYVQRCRQVNEM